MPSTLPVTENVHYSVEFSKSSYANIYLWDAEQQDVLFYVAINHKTNTIAANAQHGGRWLRPHQKGLESLNEGMTVAISLEGNSARVSLDGAEVLRCDSGFSGFDRIAQVELRGGIRAESVRVPARMVLLKTATGELSLGTGFDLTGWGFTDSAQPRHCIEVAGLEEPLAHITTANPGLALAKGAPTANIGVQGLLPGRVWLAGGGETPPDSLRLVLTCDGYRCGGPLTISRADILGRIEAIAQRGAPEIHIDDAVTALEHVRFGRMLPDLSESAQAFVHSCARLFQLEDFLAAGTPAESGTPSLPARPPSRGPDIETLQVERLLNEFARRIHAGPEVDHISVVKDLTGPYLAPTVLSTLFLQLSVHFCSIDRFEELYALAAAQGVAGHVWRAEDQPFHTTKILPFLAMRNDVASIAACVATLEKRVNDWIVTPNLCWALQHVVRHRIAASIAGTGAAVDSMVASFLRLIERHAASYWDRAPCRHLTDTMIFLLERRQGFPHWIQIQLVSSALASYGLSRDFWTMLADRGPDSPALTPEIHAAARAFARIKAFVDGAQAEGSHEDVAQALALFEAWKNPDAARFRIELLGPFGVAMPTGADSRALLARLWADRQDCDQAVLRGLAFPGTGDGDAALSALLAQGLRTARRTIPGSGAYEMQKVASRKAQDLLWQARQTPASSHDDAVAGLLDVLAGLEDGKTVAHVGLGLAISTICGLIEAGSARTASPLISWAVAILRHKPATKNHKLFDSRYLRSVYPRLHELSLRNGDPLIRALLREFPKGFDQLPALPVSPADPGLPPAWRTASPVFDTLVAVYSCQAYLDSRVAEQRRSWLADLDRLGVPYVVVVGGGKNELVGDVLQLDCPDDYEGLPQKTLKMIEWAEAHTPFAHLLKIDDDCYLDATEFFESLSYRKCNVYGRPLERKVGQSPRAWHCEKSTSMRGRLEVDKSLEPISYPDGGTGYTLSRFAMRTVVDNAHSAAGVRLRLGSFSEDKMLGGLIGMSGLTVSNEDYATTILRKNHSAGRPVLKWVNDFFPAKGTGIKLVHLDSDKGHPEIQASMAGHGLMPKRIWPGTMPAAVGFNSNALELISDVATLERHRQAPFAVVTVLRNEMYILPHFLDHYRKAGVTSFFFVDNCSSDGTLEYLQQQSDVVLFSADTEYKVARSGTVWAHAVMSGLRMGRWSLVADADEFLIWPGMVHTRLPDYVARQDRDGVDAMRIFMLDIYPEGQLAEFDFTKAAPFDLPGYVDRDPLLTRSLATGPYSNQHTFTSALRHRILPGSRSEMFVSQKTPLVKYKPWMRLSQGCHYAAGVTMAPQDLAFAHFKYNSDLFEKAAREAQRQQYFNNAEEYQKYLNLLAEGRDVIHDPAVSVPWNDCPLVRRILDAPV